MLPIRSALGNSYINKITCPHCGKAFEIDEAGYADILKQVRNSEFEQQLHDQLELAEQDKQNAIELAKTKAASELLRAAAAKDAEIHELKAKLDAIAVAQKLAISEALNGVEKERDALKEKYEIQIKDRDDAIKRLRDMKARLSTKMVGETLEQHCETQFNRLRATAFPNAYFEKDNDAKSGSNGDYIFRDLDDLNRTDCKRFKSSLATQP